MRVKFLLLLLCSFISFSLTNETLLKTRIFVVDYEKKCFQDEYEIIFLNNGEKIIRRIDQLNDSEIKFDYDVTTLKKLLTDIKKKDLEKIPNNHFLEEKYSTLCQLNDEMLEWNIFDLPTWSEWSEIKGKQSFFEIKSSKMSLVLMADDSKYENENIKKIINFIRSNQLGFSTN